MSLKTTFYIVKDILEAASYLFVVIGFIYAVNEFYQTPDDKRRNAALGYVNTFQGDKMVDARISLLRPWLAYPIAALDGKVGSNEVIRTLATSFVFPEKGEGNLDDLVRVVEFLDRLGECVESGICDQTVVKTQISSYASDLICLYHAPLNQLRDGFALKTLGTGTMEITDQRCAFK